MEDVTISELDRTFTPLSRREDSRSQGNRPQIDSDPEASDFIALITGCKLDTGLDRHSKRIASGRYTSVEARIEWLVEMAEEWGISLEGITVEKAREDR